MPMCVFAITMHSRTAKTLKVTNGMAIIAEQHSNPCNAMATCKCFPILLFMHCISSIEEIQARPHNDPQIYIQHPMCKQCGYSI